MSAHALAAVVDTSTGRTHWARDLGLEPGSWPFDRSRLVCAGCGCAAKAVKASTAADRTCRSYFSRRQGAAHATGCPFDIDAGLARVAGLSGGVLSRSAGRWRLVVPELPGRPGHRWDPSDSRAETRRRRTLGPRTGRRLAPLLNTAVKVAALLDDIVSHPELAGVVTVAFHDGAVLPWDQVCFGPGRYRDLTDRIRAAEPRPFDQPVVLHGPIANRTRRSGAKPGTVATAEADGVAACLRFERIEDWDRFPATGEWLAVGYPQRWSPKRADLPVEAQIWIADPRQVCFRLPGGVWSPVL